ncbi:hypothetical protein MPER_11143 [Moniliophthora perniciosa FA553]|nr:hypothetical protein MPER_11143 [Moniliophthora perniciosa FA553]
MTLLCVTESKLQDKNRAMILDVSDEIIDICERAVKEHEDQKRSKQAQGESLTNAQKGKAILTFAFFTTPFLRWKILTSGQYQLIIFVLRSTGQADGALRTTAMLLVGAYLYGFGNWEQMAKDPKLNLEGKFFLEEGKKGEDAATRPIPNAIHLVRRGDYLLGLLREYDEKIRSYETTLRHKSHVKVSQSPPPPASSSSSHISSIRRRAEMEAVASVDDPSTRKRKRRPTPTFTDSESSDEWKVLENIVSIHVQADMAVFSPSMDEAATKEELRPVKKQLKQLKLSGEDMPRDDKVAILKDSLAAIGRRIEFVLTQKQQAGEDRERWRRHLWTFVTLFWPKKVKASKLEEIHAKMVMKEAAPRTSSDPATLKKPRLSGSGSGAKTNGSTPSSSRTNGKSYR